ncbi:MAG: phage portal protein [Prevotella sp.]|nr:phage portal protein [Prevotella sp.]
MDIQEIISKAENGENVIGQLQQKSITVPPWGDLVKQYDPMLHPVMDKSEYPDITVYEERESESMKNEFGEPVITKVATGVEKVSRVTYALQDLAVKRTTELCFGIPVKRIYSPENDRQKEIAQYIEKIYQRNHIDTVNNDRGRKLFASCETMTLWYAIPEENSVYGFNSKLKLRCVTYSPMQGDSLYPLFDELGDLVALSVKYTRKVEEKDVTFFDTYTSNKHLRWSNEESVSMTLDLDEDIEIGKIPAVYIYRPVPIWENTSSLVYEMEWAVSRNGNYLRKNSRPILAAFVNEEMAFGKSPSTDKAFRDVVQYPQGSSLQYVTWNQAIDNLKYYVNELRQMFFTQLQLPDMSYENMKTTPMSGEARKQLFIDCHLKVKDESGRWIEFFERETNVIKAYLKIMLPSDYASDIDALPVEQVITPYTVKSDAEDLNIYINATGGKQLMSQSTAIQKLGMVDDVDDELQKIQAEGMQDLLAGAMAE